MAATILASQIGQGALVANHIALLVWMSTCPLIDGLSVVFAPTTAELLYGGHFAHLKRHVYQLVASGLIVGCVFAFAAWALKAQILAVLMGPDPADVSIGANLNLVWNPQP
jgi:Na+-driven multidrug efflux pump